jgi:hypothetical protein
MTIEDACKMVTDGERWYIPDQFSDRLFEWGGGGGP